MKRTLIAKIARKLYNFFYLKVVEHVCVSELQKSVRLPRLTDGEQQIFLDSPETVQRHREFIPDELCEEFSNRCSYATGLLHIVDGQLAAYMWVTDQSMENEGVAPFTHRVDLGRGETYVFDAFTYPQYRNTRVFYKTALCLLQHLKTSGCKAVYIIFDSRNPRWINFYERLGFKVIGSLRFKRVFGFASKDTAVIDGSQRRSTQRLSIHALAAAS
jgi:ribosomal protein S18 acetylase RimI-like enzyme